MATATVSADPAVNVSGPDVEGTAYGLGYETKNFELSHDGNEMFSPGDTVGVGKFQTYSFQEVKSVGLVAARATDHYTQRTNQQLTVFIRENSEFVNEYYASGLGSMGGVGFDINDLNAANSQNTGNDGWVNLGKPSTEYGGSDGWLSSLDDLATGLVEDALEQAENRFGVAFTSDFDKAFVVSPEREGSNPFYGGNVVPKEPGPIFWISTLGLQVRATTELINAFPAVDPLEAPSGETDGVYTAIDSSVWRHELGHAAGSDNLIGLPDLYWGARPFNTGLVQDWGLMGNGDRADTLTSFSRFMGGDIWDISKSWAELDTSVHLLEESVSTEPLTEKEIGDSVNLVVSAFTEFNTVLDYGVDPRTWEVSILPVSPSAVFYFIEQRQGGQTTTLTDPADGEDLWKSPHQSEEDGVAIYRMSVLDFDTVEMLDRLLDFDELFEIPLNSPIELSDFLGVDYMTRGGKIDGEDYNMDVTLSAEDSSADSWYDRRSYTQFSLTDGSTVDMDRDVGDLVLPDNKIVRAVIVEISDFIIDLGTGEFSRSGGGETMPTVDLIVETEAGERIGRDPETGRFVNELENGRIIGTEGSYGVEIPGDVEIDVSVSDRRLKEFLDSHDVEVPDRIPYERTYIVDNDTTVVEKDGIPHLEGRHKQTVKTLTSEEGQAITSVEASAHPPNVNLSSEGQFVTVFVEVPEGQSAEDLQLESVTLDTVHAVTDEGYGFVKNVPTEIRNGDTYAMVKFPRQRLLHTTGVGDHTLTLLGTFGRTTFESFVDLEVFDPEGNGPPDDNPGNGPPDDNPGNGPPHGTANI